jgi:CheY-like chemotaxis protein
MRCTSRTRPRKRFILSDINMPGVDGLSPLSEVKKVLPDIPVMVVTA